MLNELQWESLEFHREQFCVIMLYNILKQDTHLPLIWPEDPITCSD